MLKRPDIFYLMIDAGLASTGLGIQSGSEEFAKKYYHRTNTNKSYIQYAKLLFDNDVTAQYQFIGGNCYETEEDFRKTLNLRKQLPFSIHTPHMTQTVSFRLKLFPNVPIIEMCPKLVTHPTPIKEWAREALLLNLVNVVPEDIFEELYANKLYHDNPLALQTIYWDELNKLQTAYYDTLLLKWTGKRIAFYGAGYIFENSYEYFASLQPECILLDKQFIKGKKAFGNLPIYEVEDFLQKNNDVHILCFSRPATILLMVLKLTRHFGIARNRIDLCAREFLNIV